ncbi:MAG: hypothetical protein H0W99_05370 [Acidobacteria bacterium]|nr:hypothetical protein [Acidobacteriota bacterium]
MAVKKEPRRLHNPVKAKSAKAAKQAAHLAPPEEQNGKQRNQNSDGAIVVDTAKLRLPKGVLEEEKGGTGLFGMNPLVLLLFCFSLAFIAFIAYLISIEPPAK